MVINRTNESTTICVRCIMACAFHLALIGLVEPELISNALLYLIKITILLHSTVERYTSTISKTSTKPILNISEVLGRALIFENWSSSEELTATPDL